MVKRPQFNQFSPIPSQWQKSFPPRFYFLICELILLFIFLSIWSEITNQKHTWKEKDLESTPVFQESATAVNLWKTSVESKQDSSIILHENSEMAQFQTLANSGNWVSLRKLQVVSCHFLQIMLMQLRRTLTFFFNVAFLSFIQAEGSLSRGEKKKSKPQKYSFIFCCL